MQVLCSTNATPIDIYPCNSRVNSAVTTALYMKTVPLHAMHLGWTWAFKTEFNMVWQGYSPVCISKTERIQFPCKNHQSLPTMASIFEKFFRKWSDRRSVTVLIALQSFKTGQMSLRTKTFSTYNLIIVKTWYPFGHIIVLTNSRGLSVGVYSWFPVKKHSLLHSK